MSCFVAKKLDINTTWPHPASVKNTPTAGRGSHIARTVRSRIEQGGERVWRFDDFRDLPPGAMAQALSRLTREGVIERLSKGIYYRPRQTTLGKSLPNPTAIRALAAKKKNLFPSGLSAANLLGFTTQTGSRGEVATDALSLPRKLVGTELIVHTRRPEAWDGLSDEDAALLDFLRRAGQTSELPPHQTIRRTTALLLERGRFNRLAKIAASEPPRARAVLGALGEQIGVRRALLKELRESLNPLSRFEFGVFSALPNASNWQAKAPS